VVGTSHNLGHRAKLAADLEAAADAEILLVELKAAAIDVAARLAQARGMRVVFCDNRAVLVGGEGTFDDLGPELAATAVDRFERTLEPSRP
ncbi:MAG: 2,3-diphosphoglycerate synthetase, partial [Acidimicrobiales bacterium]